MPILENAIIAGRVYDNLADEQKKCLEKFHLRPTQSGITVVSTLPYAAMRGVDVTTEAALKTKLEGLAAAYPQIMADDEEAAGNYLITQFGFQLRTHKTEELLEEDFQARMINFMHHSNLAKLMGLPAGRTIRFIASEFIFEQGNNRIDIIGFDGEIVYLFELKKDRTRKVKQVRDYVDYYTSPAKVATFVNVLRSYPINPLPNLPDVPTVRGVMVMRDAANARNNPTWGQLAAEHNVDILFFEESITFRKIN